MEHNIQHIQPEKVISINDLYKSFNGMPVLRGVRMDLFRGENVVVLGKSGSGKSVLIKLIAGLLKYDAGSIKVFGREVANLSKKELDELRIRVGFCFQNSALYDSMTIGENLDFPLSHHIKLRAAERNKLIKETLDAVGLLSHIHKMPAELSGGQRKRAGIARTLILKPEIMLYDEPTSGLDPITSGEINELIKTVQQQYKTSAIIITHDLTCAKEVGDRMLMLLDGNIFKEGSFEELFHSDDERLKAFYNYNFTR